MLTFIDWIFFIYFFYSTSHLLLCPMWTTQRPSQPWVRPTGATWAPPLWGLHVPGSIISPSTKPVLDKVLTNLAVEERRCLQTVLVKWNYRWPAPVKQPDTHQLSVDTRRTCLLHLILFNVVFFFLSSGTAQHSLHLWVVMPEPQLITAPHLHSITGHAVHE